MSPDWAGEKLPQGRLGGYEANALCMIKNIASYLRLRSLYILSLDAAGHLVAAPLHSLGAAPLLPFTLSQFKHSPTECTMTIPYFRGFIISIGGQCTWIARRDRGFSLYAIFMATGRENPIHSHFTSWEKNRSFQIGRWEFLALHQIWAFSLLSFPSQKVA